MNSSTQKLIPVRKPETFLLVHGAWFGAWCWERVEGILHLLGHRTICPDLPGHGTRKEPIAEQTLQSYVDEIVRILDEQPEPVILVGHSMGGAVVTMVAEARPQKIKKLVYFAAFMLKDGKSVNGLETGIKPIDLYARSEDGKTAPWSEKQVYERFARSCSAPDQRYIAERIGPEAIEPLVAPINPTEARWGSVRRFYIAATEDGAADPAAVQQMLAAAPCEEAYEIQADHLAFYSAPVELSYALHAIAMKD